MPHPLIQGLRVIVAQGKHDFEVQHEQHSVPEMVCTWCDAQYMQKKCTQQSSQPGGNPKVVGRLYLRRSCTDCTCPREAQAHTSSIRITLICTWERLLQIQSAPRGDGDSARLQSVGTFPRTRSVQRRLDREWTIVCQMPCQM